MHFKEGDVNNTTTINKNKARLIEPIKSELGGGSGSSIDRQETVNLPKEYISKADYMQERAKLENVQDFHRRLENSRNCTIRFLKPHPAFDLVSDLIKKDHYSTA